jgi:hypothetical protein
MLINRILKYVQRAITTLILNTIPVVLIFHDERCERSANIHRLLTFINVHENER